MKDKIPIIQIGESDRERWKIHFACRTPEKISLRAFGGGFQCRGCSGCCGMTGFQIDRVISQPELDLSHA